MAAKGKYNFVVSPFFIGIVLAVSVACSLHYATLPVKPVLQGIISQDIFSGWKGTTLSVLFILFTALSIYRFNERSIMAGKNGLIVPLLYILFASSSSAYLSFSGISVASLLVVRSISFSLCPEKNDHELFLAAFLISCAAIFEPFIIYLIPCIIFFSLRAAITTARTVTLSLSGVILPYAITLSLVYLFKGELSPFISGYISGLSRVDFTYPGEGSTANVVFTVSLIVYLISASIHVLKNINRYKILKSSSFARIISVMIITGITSFLYSSTEGDMIAITAIPASFLAAEYSCSGNVKQKGRVALLIILILLVLSRISVIQYVI
jgi:hypothetical protein